jgi:hypothetical protein
MALSADRRIQARNPGSLTPAKVTASHTIYGGSLVERTTATGLVHPAADTASSTFAGVAREQVVGNSAGTSIVELYQSGDFEFGIAATTEADVGSEVYTADADNAVATTGTTYKCGRIVEFLSTTSVMVRIDGYAF